MDGLKNSPFIFTCFASSDKLYYENKSSFHNRMDGLKTALLSSLALQVRISYILLLQCPQVLRHLMG